MGIKRVHFNDKVKVHHLVTWDYASRAARRGPWMYYGINCARFKRRIRHISYILKPILLAKLEAQRHTLPSTAIKGNDP